MKLPRIMIATEKAKAALEAKKKELVERLNVEKARDTTYEAAKKDWDAAAIKLMANPAVKVLEVDGSNHYDDENDTPRRAITATIFVPDDFPPPPSAPRRPRYEESPSRIEGDLKEIDQLLRLLALTEDATVPASMLRNIAEFI